MPSARRVFSRLPASFVARNTRAILDFAAENEKPIRAVVRTIDLLPIEFCEQNQGQRVVNLRRGIGEDVAHTDHQLTVVQSCSVIQACEWKELNFDLRQWGAGPQLPVSCPKDSF